MCVWRLSQSLTLKHELLGLEICPCIVPFHPHCSGEAVCRSQSEGGRKRTNLTAASPFPSRRHLKLREACLPSSEGSDKCNHTV